MAEGPETAGPPWIVTIGASAGGVGVLTTIAAGLSADFPAAVLVVLHVPPGGTSRLPEIIDRAGPLPSRGARDGEAIQSGCILVAPADRHLVVDGDAVRLRRGPRINGQRPSVDVLFDSAARNHGSRVIGVVLSGALSDGTLGLRAIKQHGGIAIAQADAVHEGMPTSAIENVDVDHVVPAHEIATRLTMLVRIDEEGDVSDEAPLDLHVADAELGSRLSLTTTGPPTGAPTMFRCPECGGALWQLEGDALDSYACHVGHVFSADSLVESQADDVERAIWTAVRILEEKAALAERLAERMSAKQRRSKERFQRRAREAEAQADLVRRVLLGQVDEADRLEAEGMRE